MTRKSVSALDLHVADVGTAYGESERAAPSRPPDPSPQRGSIDQLSPSEVVDRVDELLEATYRSGDLGNIEDVLSETIYILLSLNTREAVYQTVFRSLRAAYPRWADAATASPSDLAEVLKPGGLQSQRADYLKAILQAVRTDNIDRGVGPGARADQDITLEYLHEMDDDEAEAFLIALPGVGKKSARCVMAYALDRQTFAVDTHVARIFGRLGLIPNEPKPDHDLYQAIVPERSRRRLHINLIHHGRSVCANRAQCRACVLVSFCHEGRERVAVGDPRPTAVDLFAGAGGLGHGFRRAGWRVAVAVEQDRDAAQTYRANNPGTPVLEADVTSLSAGHIEAASPGLGQPDAVLAGPPCQGYSAAGARNPGDPKNLLYEHVARLADSLGASLIVLENVPGLRRVNGIGFVDDILAALGRNRDVTRHELIASDFGVPQARRRLFFLARQEDLGAAPGAPPASHSTSEDDVLPTTPSLESVLRGVLEVPSGRSEDTIVMDDGSILANVATMRHSESVINKITAIEPGRGPISYRRLERDLARTLVAGHRALPVHPWLDRTISVREAARIQGFPDTYVFCGPRANQPLQVANAVPPPVAEALARHILRALA